MVWIKILVRTCADMWQEKFVRTMYRHITAQPIILIPRVNLNSKYWKESNDLVLLFFSWEQSKTIASATQQIQEIVTFSISSSVKNRTSTFSFSQLLLSKFKIKAWGVSFTSSVCDSSFLGCKESSCKFYRSRKNHYRVNGICASEH